jgi:hypothetical protein
MVKKETVQQAIAIISVAFAVGQHFGWVKPVQASSDASNHALTELAKIVSEYRAREMALEVQLRNCLGG